MTEGTNAAGAETAKRSALKSEGPAKQLGLLLAVGGRETVV